MTRDTSQETARLRADLSWLADLAANYLGEKHYHLAHKNYARIDQIEAQIAAVLSADAQAGDAAAANSQAPGNAPSVPRTASPAPEAGAVSLHPSEPNGGDSAVFSPADHPETPAPKEIP